MSNLVCMDQPALQAQSRSIDVITEEIQFYKAQAGSAIVEIGRRLNEAKAQLNHGEWLDWLREKVELSERSAQNFMRLAREYGKSATVADLGTRKALLLLDLNPSEREAFIAETHLVDGQEKTVADMTSKELEKAIRERDEARKRVEEAEKKEESLQTDLEMARRQAEDAEKKVARLEEELEKLRSGSVDVAVEAADPKELDAARKEVAAAAKKEAETALKMKIDLAEEKRKAAEAELAKLKERQKSAEEAAKAANEQIQKAKADAEEQIRKEKEAAAARIATLEKQLRAAGNPEIMTFGYHFDAAQGHVNSMVGCLKKLELMGDAISHNKLLTALKALAQSILTGAPAPLQEEPEEEVADINKWAACRCSENVELEKDDEEGELAWRG